METYQAGLAKDPDNQELKDGLLRCIQAINKVCVGVALVLALFECSLCGGVCVCGGAEGRRGGWEGSRWRQYGRWVRWQRGGAGKCLAGCRRSAGAAAPCPLRCYPRRLALQMNRGEVDESELKERQARAMADPEVQSILSDPVMRQVI